MNKIKKIYFGYRLMRVWDNGVLKSVLKAIKYGFGIRVYIDPRKL